MTDDRAKRELRDIAQGLKLHNQRNIHALAQWQEDYPDQAHAQQIEAIALLRRAQRIISHMADGVNPDLDAVIKKHTEAGRRPGETVFDQTLREINADRGSVAPE